MSVRHSKSRRVLQITDIVKSDVESFSEILSNFMDHTPQLECDTFQEVTDNFRTIDYSDEDSDFRSNKRIFETLVQLSYVYLIFLDLKHKENNHPYIFRLTDDQLEFKENVSKSYQYANALSYKILLNSQYSSTSSQIYTSYIKYLDSYIKANQSVCNKSNELAERSWLCSDSQNYYSNFHIKIVFDSLEKIWVAECDMLSLVTEASTYEDLIERVKVLAPEMIKENNIQIINKKYKLSFEYSEEFEI